MTYAASMPTRAERHDSDWHAVWAKHRDRHCIWIVTAKGRHDSLIFNEVALVLQQSFEKMGGSAPIVLSRSAFGDRLPIILGPNLLGDHWQSFASAGSILVNLEQIGDGVFWLPKSYYAFLRSFPVFDFSIRNLRAAGRLHAVRNIHLMPVGYEPVLTRILPAPQQDIDILFCGSPSIRRIGVLNRLRANGWRVATIFNIYGEERDALLARAKIVLNIHYHDVPGFEIVRASYLMANRKCVVSEGTPDDPDAAPYMDAICFVSIDGFEEACAELLADDEQRERLAQAGYETIRSRPQHRFLREALLSLEGYQPY